MQSNPLNNGVLIVNMDGAGSRRRQLTFGAPVVTSTDPKVLLTTMSQTGTSAGDLFVADTAKPFTNDMTSSMTTWTTVV